MSVNSLISLINSACLGIKLVAAVITPISGVLPVAGVAEPGKGAGLKTLSRRGPRVQIPPPAC